MRISYITLTFIIITVALCIFSLLTSPTTSTTRYTTYVDRSTTTITTTMSIPTAPQVEIGTNSFHLNKWLSRITLPPTSTWPSLHLLSTSLSRTCPVLSSQQHNCTTPHL